MYTIHGSGKNISNKVRWSNILRIEDANNMPHLDGDDYMKSFNLKG